MINNNTAPLEIASQRVDLFISYSQHSLLNKKIPTADLIPAFCRALDDCLVTASSKPSVFYRGGKNDNNSHVGKVAHIQSEDEDVVRAVMRLRGGGLALCIFSDDYFEDQKCIAELSTLLLVQQEDPDITFLFCTPSSQFLQNNRNAIQLFPDLRFSVVSTLSPDQQPAEAVNCLVSLVCDVWNVSQYAIPPRPRCYCLGRHKLQSFLSLKPIFREVSPISLQNFPGSDYVSSYPSFVSSNSDSAPYQRIITLDDLSELKEYALQLSSEILQSAIDEYERKWISSTKFDWGKHKFSDLYQHLCKPPNIFVSNHFQESSCTAVAEELPKEIFMVPNNLSHVHCDFETADMPEAKLKSMVLSDAFDATKCTTVIGMAGTGKTCALLALGHLKETRRRFHGGILYMSVGQNAGLSKLVACIANVVEAAGGLKKAREIRRNKFDYSFAINSASNWFQHQPVLFLIDDIWAVRGINSSVVDKLSGLAKNPQSRIALTTRDVFVCSGNVLQFPKLGPCSRHASRILSFSAKQKAPPIEPSEYAAFSKILDACCGLRLSLAICGNAVFELKKECADDQSAWNKFADRLQPCLSYENDLFENATKNVEKALGIAQEQEPNFDWEGTAKYFCIAKRNHTIPISVFQRLWNKNAHETEMMLQYFERFSLVQILIDFVSSGTQVRVLVHDDILEYSRKPSSQKDRLWICRKLVHSYTSSFPDVKTNRFLPSPISSLRSFVKLQRSSFADLILNTADDGYLYDHICHLLGEAGLSKELLDLFTAPQWVISLIELKGAIQIEADVAIAINKFRQDETFPSTKLHSAEQFLCALKDASFLSLYDLGENWDKQLLWSQLYSRLQWLRTNLFGEVFLKRMEECSPRLWKRSTEELLPPAGCSLKHLVRIHGRILCSQVVKNMVFIAFIENEELFTTCYNCDHATGNGPTSIPCDGMIEDIRVAQFSPTCESLAVGFKDGSIKVWIGVWLDVFSTSQITTVTTANVLERNNDQCWSISGADLTRPFLRGTGRKATLSHISEIGPVRMIKFDEDMLNERRSAEMFMENRKGDLYFVKLEGHTDAISSVCVSLDGTLVVSGSDDNTVRMWKRSKNGWSLDKELHFRNGHIQVSVSWDGKRVVIGSADKCLRAWELQNGAWTFVTCAENNFIENSVCLSPDGMWVGSTSGRKVMFRTWPKNFAETDFGDSESRIEEVFSISGVLSEEVMTDLPDNEICSVRMSNGGNRFVAASRSGELVLWENFGEGFARRVLVNRDVSEAVVESLGPDGRVLSRHGDGTVKVWETNRGKWEVEPYHEYLKQTLGNHLGEQSTKYPTNHLRMDSQILSKRGVKTRKVQQRNSRMLRVFKQVCAPFQLH